MAEDQRKVFVVVPGIPARFADLSVAEAHAAEMCERTGKDHVVFAADAGVFDYALVARFFGVRFMTLREAEASEEEE